jgi:hypothetical protein
MPQLRSPCDGRQGTRHLPRMRTSPELLRGSRRKLLIPIAQIRQGESPAFSFAFWLDWNFRSGSLYFLEFIFILLETCFLPIGNTNFDIFIHFHVRKNFGA